MKPKSSFASRRADARGFTLIELIVTMAVGGILTCIAIPAFSSFVQNDRDVEQINSLVSSLSYARSEAIKRDSQGGITVCPSVDGATCSGGTNWYGGWVVIDSTPTDAPLQTVPALNGGNTLSATGSVTGAVTAITFQSSGMVTPSQTTVMKVCDPRGAAFARELEVNSTGRVAAAQKAGFSVSNIALTCP